MSQTIRSEFHTSLANIFINDVQLLKANYYYYLGRVDPWSATDLPESTEPVFSLSEDSNIRDNIVYMRRIMANDISLAAPRYDWTVNVVYDRWDDRQAMYGKKFYVITDDLRVYKCLDNNNGVPSTVKPESTSFSVFRTSDNYLWKYMYTVPPFKYTKFASSSHLPVQRALSDSFYNRGAIQDVIVTSGGSGYDNTIPTIINVNNAGVTTGSGAGTITLTIVGTVITAASISSGGSGYTKGARISITTTSGTGAVLTPVITSGVISSITVTEGGFGYVLANTTATVDNSGGAVLRAAVSSTTNQIVGVTIIDPGIGYTAAPALTVTCPGSPTATGLYGNSAALLSAVVYDGVVQRVNILDPGQNYLNTPNAMNIIGDGTGAICIPVVNNSGSIVDVVMENPGTGYTFATVSISGAGSGANFSVNIGQNDYVSDQSIIEQTAVPGAIYAIRIEDAGNNHTANVVVNITGDGIGATAQAYVELGKIVNIQMTSFGSGYSYANVSFTDPLAINLTPATASIIAGPIFGHGHDAVEELYAATISISSVLRDDAVLNSVAQDYRQFGIIRNPTDFVTSTDTKTNSELVCYNTVFNNTTGLVKDELLICGNYKYRVVTFDANEVLLQPIGKTYVTPIGLITSVIGARTYSVQSILKYPVINKYSGSLLLLSNESPFQFTTEQGLSIKTYIEL